MDKVDAFTKEMKKKWRASETKSVKRKDSEERKELEKTFEIMVVQMAALEQHISLLQKTLCEQKTEVELMDEGKELVEHSSEIAQQLALNLSQTQQKLVSRSSGSSNGSSRRSSGDSLPESEPCSEFSQKLQKGAEKLKSHSQDSDVLSSSGKYLSSGSQANSSSLKGRCIIKGL